MGLAKLIYIATLLLAAGGVGGMEAMAIGVWQPADPFLFGWLAVSSVMSAILMTLIRIAYLHESQDC